MSYVSPYTKPCLSKESSLSLRPIVAGSRISILLPRRGILPFNLHPSSRLLQDWTQALRIGSRSRTTKRYEANRDDARGERGGCLRRNERIERDDQRGRGGRNGILRMKYYSTCRRVWLSHWLYRLILFRSVLPCVSFVVYFSLFPFV